MSAWAGWGHINMAATVIVFLGLLLGVFADEHSHRVRSPPSASPPVCGRTRPATHSADARIGRSGRRRVERALPRPALSDSLRSEIGPDSEIRPI